MLSRISICYRLKVSILLCLIGIYVADAQTPSCQRNWTYFAKSNKCLKVFAAGNDTIPTKNSSDAENYCSSFRGHLASVDSEDEITFIVRLSHAAGYDDSTSGDPGSRLHIGLTFASSIGWIRPDGKRLEYLRWYPFLSDSDIDGRFPCGILTTTQRWTGYMNVAGADQPFPFVCETDPLERDLTMEELEERLVLTEEKKRELLRENLGLVLNRDFFHVAFNTDAYLHDFYTQLEEPAMRMIHTFMPTIVAKLPKGGRMCDFGAGPTIHLAVCFRHCADEIYFADYLPQNRNELIRWTNKESNFDWSTVLMTIATHEGVMDAWKTMEEETRSKVRGVLHCDCLKDPSIEYPANVDEGFDIVTTTYCVEYCTNTEEEYKSAIKNIVRQIKPGGYFIMGGILEETWCSFGGRKFTCLYITEEFMLTTLRDAGLLVDDDKTTSFYQINGMFIICAKKQCQ